MNALLYYDGSGGEGRAMLRLYEWYYTDIDNECKQTQRYKVLKFNIILTSFEVFCSDLYSVFLKVPFRCIVIDEAHRLKNRAGKTLTLLKEHPCVRVFLLTGTPVQNNTKELFTLLNYIEPLRFRGMDALMENFGDLKNASQVQALQTLLRPFFLRRLKEEVEDSIPPLEETVVEVGLTKLQTVYYKGIYGENKYMLSKLGTNSAKAIHLNNMDIQLRKCCNHLYLLKGVEDELEGKCQTDQEYFQSLLDSSGKLILLDKFIKKYREEGHKMLVFSQFKKMLEIIEIYLRHIGVPFEVLTGSVKSQDRVMSIQRFNDDPSFGVFLLTTRAGGLGINLTSARVVVIFDSDWNPQNDLQAIARAHRIGQTHEVKVYRFITCKTYEEQMFNRASKKLGMEQALFKGSKDIDVTKAGQAGDGKPDQKEIENLLRYGAYAFLDEEGDDMADMDIEEIFTKNTKSKKKKGGKSLNKSTFNVGEYEKKLDKLNDDDFWKEVLPSLEVLSVQALEKKLKFERSDMIKSEDAQKEFLGNLKKLVEQLLETKKNAADVFSTEDDETRLRDLMMKFCKVHKMKPQVREDTKQLLRDLNQSIELLSYEAKFKEEKQEEKEEEEKKEKAKVEEIEPQPEEKRGKQRVRRKRKANNNVVYDQDNLGDDFEDKEKQKAKRPKKNDDDGDEYVLEDSEQPYPGKGGIPPADGEGQGEYPNKEYPPEYHQGDPKLKPGKEGSQNYEMGPGDQYPGNEDARLSKEARRREIKRQQKHAEMQRQKQQLPLNLNYTEFFPIFCGLCLRKVEDNYSCWKCQGHCGKIYRDECKKRLDMKYLGEINERADPNRWLCWLCSQGKAECFICGEIDFVKWNARKKVPSYIRNNPALAQYHKYGQQQQLQKRPEDAEKDNPESVERAPTPGVDNSSKEPHLIQTEGDGDKETEIKFRFDDPPPPARDPVIKCYTGSCPRHYHLKCLKKNHHRCLFNLNNKDEFKCSLHFCKLCGQTSEQSLLMQCLKCPISYHMKCSKQEKYLKKLSRRHIICSAHYRPPPEDFQQKEFQQKEGEPEEEKPCCPPEHEQEAVPAPIPEQEPEVPKVVEMEDEEKPTPVPEPEPQPEQAPEMEDNKEIFKIEKHNAL